MDMLIEWYDLQAFPFIVRFFLSIFIVIVRARIFKQVLYGLSILELVCIVSSPKIANEEKNAQKGCSIDIVAIAFDAAVILLKSTLKDYPYYRCNRELNRVIEQHDILEQTNTARLATKNKTKQ